MHRLNRPVLTLGLVALLAVAAAWLFGGGGGGLDGPEKAEALVPANAVSCSDIWLGPIGTGQRVAKSISRIEVDPISGKISLSIVTYLGPDTTPGDGNPVPNKPPDAAGCQVKSTAADTLAEANRLNDDVKYQLLGNQERPTIHPNATVVGNNLVFSTCVFSQSAGQWQRTDVSTSIVNKGPNAKNLGTGQLNAGTTAPSDAATLKKGEPSKNPSSCMNKTTGAFSSSGATLVFPFNIDAHTREASTDFLPPPANVVADPNGPQPPLKTTPQVDDTADGLQDDWDGDGCTDWDELSPTHGSGLDPFNPEDCDSNYTGVYNILATAVPSGPGTNNKPIPGGYFHCISKIDHNKVTNDIASNLVCYTDSPGLGDSYTSYLNRTDGLAGAPPPPPYGFGNNRACQEWWKRRMRTIR